MFISGVIFPGPAPIYGKFDVNVFIFSDKRIQKKS